MAGKPASCRFCNRRAEWAWQPFGPDESAFLFTSLGNHYRGFDVLKVCDYHKERIEWARDNKRPSVFVYTVNVWKAILPNGDVLTSPFNVDDQSPLLLGAV